MGARVLAGLEALGALAGLEVSEGLTGCFEEADDGLVVAVGSVLLELVGALWGFLAALPPPDCCLLLVEDE